MPIVRCDTIDWAKRLANSIAAARYRELTTRPPKMPIVRCYTIDWAERLAASIAAARYSVTLTALSCLPPRRMTGDNMSRLWAAIEDAQHRTGKLILILPAPSAAHPATARNAAAALKLQAIGARCHLLSPTKLLHAKTCLIDHNTAWIGSGNLTAAAAHHNREAWIATEDATTCADLAGFHAWLLASH